ncbi:MAG: heavy-metal-associated domain-containing protein [Bacteroidales bacterium]|nr:heavy-metal-associated domain-containing protein [Bacteroidales bacterium]
MKAYSIFVENLKCGGCANTIRKTVSKFSDVQKVEVDVEQSRIDFELEDSKDQIDQIKQKLAQIGYPEVGAANNFVTEAKSYVSCAIGRIGAQ